jgi:phosphate transport system permease protein
MTTADRASARRRADVAVTGGGVADAAVTDNAAADNAVTERAVARPGGAEHGAALGADVPLQIRRVTAEDAFTIIGAAVGSLGLNWVLYERVLPFSGALGFWVCWYIEFVLLYLAAAGLQWNRRVVTDKTLAVLVSAGGIFASAVVVDQLGYSFVKGLPAIAHANFWTTTGASVAALTPLTKGGVLNAAVGSLEVLAVASVASVPLGITAALFLTEVGGRMARPVRMIVNAMTALPSVVAGLLIYSLAIVTLGLPASGFAAGLAISIIMLPTVIRASEVVLRVVPGTLREASFALGASQWRTVWNVILPTARSGLTTAVVLAMALGVGETAPVLIADGFSNFMNADPFHGWQATLPTLIFTYIEDEGRAGFIARAFGASLALMLMVLVLFTIARLVGGGRPGELSRRQIRKLRREEADS